MTVVGLKKAFNTLSSSVNDVIERQANIAAEIEENKDGIDLLRAEYSDLTDG